MVSQLERSDDEIANLSRSSHSVQRTPREMHVATQDVVVGRRRRRRGCERARGKRSCGWLGFGFVGWLGPPENHGCPAFCFLQRRQTCGAASSQTGAQGRGSAFAVGVPLFLSLTVAEMGKEEQATASSMCCATGDATPLRYFDSLRGCWVGFLSIPAPTQQPL